MGACVERHAGMDAAPKQFLAVSWLLCRNIGRNMIQGMLPDKWAKGMDSLRAITATDNSLQGSLPTAWSNLTSLQVL
jgi:hypothetical protein